MQALKITLGTLKEEAKFYEVRVFDKEGRLKRIISPKDLIKRYWGKFELEKLRTNFKT